MGRSGAGKSSVSTEILVADEPLIILLQVHQPRKQLITQNRGGTRIVHREGRDVRTISTRAQRTTHPPD